MFPVNTWPIYLWPDRFWPGYGETPVEPPDLSRAVKFAVSFNIDGLTFNIDFVPEEV